jgi:hypothetical protein
VSRGFTKRDLTGALQALVDVDPRTPAEVDGFVVTRKCHFCETPETMNGERQTHDNGCAWSVALLMLTDDPNLALGIFIGEDVEEAEARLSGESDDWAEEDGDDSEKSMEEIEEEAAAFTRKLDADSARRAVMAELRARPLDAEPVDDVEGMLERASPGVVWEPKE